GGTAPPPAARPRRCAWRGSTASTGRCARGSHRAPAKAPRRASARAAACTGPRPRGCSGSWLGHRSALGVLQGRGVDLAGLGGLDAVAGGEVGPGGGLGDVGGQAAAADLSAVVVDLNHHLALGLLATGGG